MHKYVVSVRYSRDGRSWSMISVNVSANSESEAIAIAKTRVPSGHRFVEVCSSCKIQ